MEFKNPIRNLHFVKRSNEANKSCSNSENTKFPPPQNTEIKQSILKVWTGCSIPKHILQLQGGRDAKELKTLHKKNIFFFSEKALI